MWHADCGLCCVADKCHFCLAPARHTFGDDAFEYRCCTTHLVWLANHENAPTPDAPRPCRLRSLSLPLHEIPEAMMARQPDMGSTGKRILQGAATLEVPAILR
jgi:hypothetical protein